ncbi:MAG: methyl-accepting chemotaxis protein [Burkholderiales bacterium]
MKSNHLSISQKLNLAFAVASSFMVALLALAYTQIEGSLKVQRTSQEMSQGMALTAEWQQQVQIHLSQSAALLTSQDASEMRKHFTGSMKNTADRISAIEKDLETSLNSSADKNLFSQITQRHQAYMSQHGEVLKLVGVNGADEAMKSKLLPAAQSYIGALQDLRQNQKESLEKQVSSYFAAVHAAEWVMLGLAVLGVSSGAFLIGSVRRSVKGPLQLAIQTTQAIASGDLSAPPIEADSRDEIGLLLSSLGSMQHSLRQLVGSIRHSTDHISTASVEIATGNQDLGNRTEQTASNLQQATSSMDQLTNNVKQSADSARQANQLASSAAEVAARGGQVVSQVVSTMDEINASSKKISDIIGVIDGIAFQTNILALNAAVEAARAGEQGRGFAVVASDVRSLAGRSAEAAKEIKSLIGASVERVEIGSRLVEDAGSTMKEIVTSVQRVSDIISEISAAASEQSDGISQVNTSVLQLDQMTQQNAALVEQGAAAAESLRDQTKRLSQLLETFKLSGQMIGEHSASASVRSEIQNFSTAPSLSKPALHSRVGQGAHMPRPAVKTADTNTKSGRSHAPVAQAKTASQPVPVSAPESLADTAKPGKHSAPSSGSASALKAGTQPINTSASTSSSQSDNTSNDGDWEHF